MQPPRFDIRNNNQDRTPLRGNSRNAAPRKRRGRVFFWLGLGGILLALAFLASVAFAFKFYSTSKKVIDSNQNTSFIQSLKDITSNGQKPLRGAERGRINILLVGLAGKNYPGANLTDSIIIASINPKTWQTALLSVPRDLYVNIPDTKSFTKINALYARDEDTDASGRTGINDLKTTLTEITGEPIDYYIACDFDGFKQIINQLGGIKVQVPKDLHDERYPGPNYSYQTFDIKAGLQDLDGDIALKYARTRHDEDGDFGRAFRQQQILEAARSKAFSVGTILNIPKMSEMLDTLGEHLRTDIQLDELNTFLDLLNKIDTHTTVSKVLDAGKSDSVMAVSHVFLGGVRAFILIPRTGDYSEIQDIAQNIFDLNAINRKEQEVENENASVAVVNGSSVSGFDAKIVTLLKKLGYEAKLARTIRVNPMIFSATANQTTIYDLAGTKPFSLEDLSKKFNAHISNNLPAELSSRCQNVDFCLVVGSDIADKLNYEENSVQDLESGYDQQSIDEKGYIDLLKKGSNVKF